MNEYLLDIDVAKISDLDIIKKELLSSLEEFSIRGLKTSYQWYIL